MRLLKQSTQVKVPVGPCVDATDGYTLETGISWATTEAYLIKHDSASVTDIGTNTWSAHLGGGYYNVTLTISNMDTLGLLTLGAHDSAMRPVRHEFMVVPANVYDALIGGSDFLQVDAVQANGNAMSGLLSGTTRFNADTKAMNGDTTAAAQAAKAALGISSGTVQTGSTTTTIKTNLSESQNDHFNGRIIVFTSGAQAGVATEITDYNGASKDLTVTAIPAAPSAGDTFVIV